MALSLSWNEADGNEADGASGKNGEVRAQQSRFRGRFGGRFGCRFGCRFVRLVLFASLLLIFSSVAEGKDPFHTRGGQALEGYDAVSYFTQGRAVKGSPSYSAPWEGVEWLFSSAENRELFLASPKRYAPQFGGYCAYGVSQGYTVRGDPEQWSVYRGKLYVNYSAGVKKQWEVRKDSYVTQARGRWPGVLQ